MSPPSPAAQDDDNASDSGDFLEVFISTAYLPHRPLSPDELQQEMAAAQQLISAKYHSGDPLFTKDGIRDVVQQLEKCKNDSTPDQGVLITGLDGRSVRFPIETGNEYKWSHEKNGPEIKRFLTKPILDYKTFDRLMAMEADIFSPMRAYLPIELAHQTELRNTQTNEPLENPILVYDYGTVRTKFDHDRQAWEASDHCAQLKSLLASAGVPAGTNKVVAFACCTMAWREEVGLKSRSIDQHALALTMRDFLASPQGQHGGDGGEVRCFAQDPSYTEIDERILQEEGVTVLEDPRGFLEVDDASVVISASPNIPLRQIVADIARPAVLIWDKVEGKDEDGNQWTDPVSDRVVDMMKHYTELEFSFQDTSFEGLAIYVRRQ